MLAHLQSLTWRFEAQGRTVWALAPYSEPVLGPDGRVTYHPRRAQETGVEGWACVDDAARAALLALAIVERDGAHLTPEARAAEAAHPALTWAERWLTLVRYMQLSDGRFANFVLDDSGRRNLSGQTSFPGGLWWTGRALWSLARYHRLTGSAWALRMWARCPVPELGEAGKTLGLFALAGLELLRAEPRAVDRRLRDELHAQQQKWRPLVEQWCERVAAAAVGQGYFPDYPGATYLPLWGYHQLHAVASAAVELRRPDLVPVCVETVRNLVTPAVEARGWFAFDARAGATKEGLCAYCLSPVVQGLAALYDATGDEAYRRLSLLAASWLDGRNDAHAVLYDPETGRCADGLDGPQATEPSGNFGAESSIEAGFMELERRRLA